MGQKKEFERAREQIVTDLKEKYKGQPLSTILAIAARDSEPINRQINSLNDSLTTLGADIKFATDLATQEFGFSQQDMQAKAAKQSKLQDLLGGLAVSQFGRQQDQAFTRETQAQNQAFDIQKMDIQQKYQSDRDTQNYIPRPTENGGCKCIRHPEAIRKSRIPERTSFTQSEIRKLSKCS